MDGFTKNSIEQDNFKSPKSKEIPIIEPATLLAKFKKSVSLPSKFKIPDNSIPTPNLTPKAPEHPYIDIPDSLNDPLVFILDKHNLIPAANFSNKRDSAMTKLDSSKHIEGKMLADMDNNNSNEDNSNMDMETESMSNYIEDWLGQKEYVQSWKRIFQSYNFQTSI